MSEDIKSQILEHLFEGIYYVDRFRRVTYWNKAAEQITGYTQQDVLKRRCADSMLCHVSASGQDLCKGGCPLHATLSNGEKREMLVYLKHKQGHRIPVKIRVAPVYNNDGAINGAVELFSHAQDEINKEQKLKVLEKLAYVDPLTELPNRRYMESKIESRLNELRRYLWPFGLVFLDIDAFKSINDNFGHVIGDKVLKMVARTLKEGNRGSDVFGRFGGEEFVGVIANADGEKLISLADRLRVLIESSFIEHNGKRISVTVSIGVAEATPHDSMVSLLERADIKMYRAKKTGRNRVIG